MSLSCDIIIPVWNEPEATEQCISRLKEHTTYPHRLIIIDNGSGEAVRSYLERLESSVPALLLIRNEHNIGFVKAVNRGLRESRAPYVVILNNDAYVTKGWLSTMIAAVEHGPENIGVCNPNSNVFGGSPQKACRYEIQEMDSCKGFCMLVKRAVIEKIGYLDEAYGMGYFEEEDYCFRAVESGFICVRSKEAFVYHDDKGTFGKLPDRDEIFRHSEEIFTNRWGRKLNIAVIERGKDLKKKSGLIGRLLAKGHRLYIMYPRHCRPLFLKDHIQIRYLSLPHLFFGLHALAKIYKRIRRKKIDCIITTSGRGFYSLFKDVHRAEVLSGGDEEIFDRCLKKSREL